MSSIRRVSFLDELIKAPPSIDPDRLGEAGGNIGPLASEQLKEASRTIEAKGTPEEVEEYKRFVWTVAQAVATAHKEGGFLGVGGKEISEAEQQALDENLHRARRSSAELMAAASDCRPGRRAPILPGRSAPATG